MLRYGLGMIVMMKLLRIMLNKLKKSIRWKLMLRLLNNFKIGFNKHKLYLTRKIVKKFSKFGWTTRLRNYHLGELQAINSDESHWLNLFVWRVEQDRLDRLRPSAAFTFPDLENSRRSVPFGENYQKFNLFTKNNSIILKLGQHEIPGMPSSYFKDLKIDKIGSSYIFKYIRGNNSPLDEKRNC